MKTISLVIVLVGANAMLTHNFYANGTRGYKKASLAFAVSEAEALKIAINNREKCEYKYFDGAPLAIIGDYFFFGIPQKSNYSLTGIYVNGYNGRVEFRKYPKMLGRRPRFVSGDDYVEIMDCE